MYDNRGLINKIIIQTKLYNLKWVVEKTSNREVKYVAEFNITKKKTIRIVLEKLQYSNGSMGMWLTLDMHIDGRFNKTIRTIFHSTDKTILLLYGYIKFFNIISYKMESKTGKLALYVINLIKWTIDGDITWWREKDYFYINDITIGTDKIFIQVFNNRIFIKRSINSKSTDMVINVDLINSVLFNTIKDSEKENNEKDVSLYKHFIGVDDFYDFLKEENILKQFVKNAQSKKLKFSSVSTIHEYLLNTEKENYMTTIFIWDTSTEGHDFWNKYHDKWLKKIKYSR